MSSLTMPLEEVLVRPEFSQDATEFLTSFPADVLVIMTLWKDAEGASHRRIAVFSPSRVYREQITDVILHAASPNLDLQPLTSPAEVENISAFIQNNIQVSRKGVLPLIRDFLAGEMTSPDENLNALMDTSNPWGDPYQDSDKGDHSEEEARRHINIAKTFQSDQFRTSQDRYDLAAVGTDALISPSLSTDSELSSAGKRRGEEEDFENEGLGNIREEEREFDEAGKNTDDVDDLLSGGVGGNVSSSGGVGFVDNLIDFGMDESRNQGEGADFGDDHMTVPLGVKRDKSNEVIDLLSGMVDSQNHTSTSESSASLEPQSSLDLLAGLDFGASSLQPNTQTDASAHMQAELLADTQADILSSNLEEVDAELTPATTAAEATAPTKLSADDTGVGEDILVNHTPFDLLCPNNVDSPLELPSMPTSGAASGQGSKVPSYPDTPPNSYMEPSGIAYFKETQLPSFNSSEMVRRIHEKKAALAGHTAKRLATDNPDDEGESLSPWGAGSSGGGGSLISPAVPQNSFADLTQGFDFMSSSHQLPKLSNTDIVERVTEKRSQFEWSVESLEGSSSGVDVGHNGDEGGQKLHGGDGLQMGLVAGSDPQVPYTPTNSYVEASFDTYARSNLPSMNNAEVAAKIKAKQSAMFGSGSSSRVSRSSHGSDDSGGCHSPEVVGKGSRGASLDSPQVPYTPQNSYRDNLNMLEAGNRLPDLNEVAERLSIENSSKRKFGKGSASNSGGGSRDEENMNPGPSQPHQQQQQQQQQQQTRNGSDSQNTMSDVESLMSVSTDVGTPSDNVVASNIASQIRAEASPLSRKDTGDSDVFASGRSEDNIGAGEDGRQRDNQLNLQSRNAPGSQDQMDKNDDNGENKEEDVNHKASNGFAGTQELFSPVDSSQLQTLEDHAIFEAAEDIVARSVAAAVRVSQTEPQQRRSSGRLRWDDNVVQANCVNFEERQADYEVSEDEEEDAELLAEGLPDGGEDLDSDEDNQGSTYFSTENNIVSQNLTEEMAEHNNQTLASPAAGSQGQGYFNHLPESETQSSEVEQLSTSGTGQIQSSMESSGEQGISDQALNELAFELANELIQSALEDFPFHQGAAAASNGEDVEGDAGNNKKDIEREEMLGGQENADRISTSSMEIPTIRDEGNGKEQGMSPGKFGDEQGETISTDRSPGKDRKSSGTLLDARKHSASSLDSNSSSSSSERKRSRDADSAMTIMEDEVKISFPERKPSSEFGTVEETEEEIQSFPGRKFSKSEDYPSRRFSRDDNSSRRSSRMEDSDIEVGIGPEGIETDYLPGMDPLQGNLDIIDGSFSKMTDSDREVVEGESFRKVSHHDKDEGGDGKEEEVDNEKVLEGYRRRLSGETYGLAAEREKEERELREKQSSIGDEQSAAVGRGGAESYEGKQNEDEALFDDRKADAEVAQVNKPTLKQKKKIRVSFSEDFDDEVGDFNIVSSTRSPLKSPPPPISLEHEATLSSSAPLFTDEVGGAAAAAVEETVSSSVFAVSSSSPVLSSSPPPSLSHSTPITPQDVDQPSPSPPHVKLENDENSTPVAEIMDYSNSKVSHAPPSPTLSPPHVPPPEQEKELSEEPPRPKPRREVYLTTAGRISIAGEEEEVGGSRSSDSHSPRPSSQTKLDKSSIGQLIESAEETLADADHDLDVFGTTPTTPVPPLPKQPTNEDEDSNRNASSSVAFDVVNPASNVCNPVTSDPSVSQHDPEPDPSVTSSDLDQSHVPAKPKRDAVLSDPRPCTPSSDPLTSASKHARNLSSTSFCSVKGAVYSEEWQDDEITEMARDSGIATDSSPPDPLRKKIVPDSAFAQGIADGDDLDDDEEEEDKNDDDDDNGSDIGDLEWENDTPVTMVARPGIEPTMAAESTAQASQRWKRVSVSGADFDIDLLAVEPYKSVLSHGGYYEEGLSAIIVFYGCHLPSRRQEDYSYIMNHLFHYVIHTLEELVADDYVIIYFHGSTPRRQMPGLGWLKRCYQSIDRRLKKNLKGLFLVHPTLWLRTVVTMIKPFISSKFSSKLRFVRSLEELNSLVPMDKVNIPDVIVQLEELLKHNPQYLEEQDMLDKKQMKEEEKELKKKEKEKKKEEKEKKKMEKKAEKDRKKEEKKEKKKKK